ncbi:MAG: polyphosphate kinase 1, partial [Coriobacteriales bacterium]
GCNVLYGFEGYKVHSKICLITRSIDGEMHRIVQLSTGNYNEKTAKLYSDIMFMTADPHIGADAAAFFRNMQIGDLEGRYLWLLVAPVNLRDSLLGRVDEQIERVKAGKEARLVFKMNSLTDLQVIKKLVEASQAGVKINLIIRGICCLVPGIEGVTDNITVTSIVGRFLEHARIYCFLNGDDSTEIFLSSADLMTRNTEHRVEIGFPVRSTDMKRAILHFLGVQLSDNVKARVLQPDGTYRRYPQLPGRPAVECQQVFMDEATQAARVKRKEDDRSRKAHDERPGKVNR